MAFSPSEVISHTLVAFVLLIVAGLLFKCVAPFYGYFLDPIGIVDRLVGSGCDTLVKWFGCHCREVFVFFADVGVPVRVIVKRLLVPFLVAGVLAELSFTSIIAAASGRSEDEARRAAWLFVCNSAVAIGFASTRQRFWAPPRKLDEKPFTLGVLLVPCILGWHVLSLCKGKYRGRFFYYSLYAAAAIAYHVYLAFKGPDKRTLRGLTTGYGGAKILLLSAVFGRVYPWLVPACAAWLPPW